MTKILLVEDDENFAEQLQQVLANYRYVVEVARTGQEGLILTESSRFDLILLDLILPELDGIKFCRALRSRGDDTLILLLTGADQGTQKTLGLSIEAGLDAGADDYVQKTADPSELLARIRALLRRNPVATVPLLEWQGLQLDPNRCQVTYEGNPIRLRMKEYSLLELFLRNQHRIFSQTALIDELWTLEETPTENTVRAHIKSLRKKLKQAGIEDAIETIYGLGYRLKRRDEFVSLPTQEGLELDTNLDKLNQVLPTLALIWQQYQERYLNRIERIVEAIAAWGTQRLDESLRDQARIEAHTLVGSLGSFGLTQAAQIARQIEQQLVAIDLGQSVAPLQFEALMAGVNRLKVAIAEVPTTQVLPEMAPKNLSLQPLRLLIVDPDVSWAAAVKCAAEALGMAVEQVTSVAEARLAIAAVLPTAIVLDLTFAPDEMDGLQLLQELTEQKLAALAVVVTAIDDFATRLRVAQLGGKAFLLKPIAAAQVMQVVLSVLQQSLGRLGMGQLALAQPESALAIAPVQLGETGMESAPLERMTLGRSASLLVVDDDAQILEIVRRILQPLGFRLALLDDPQDFWRSLDQTQPDLLLLNIEMPQCSGIDLCHVVRNDPIWRALPVLFLSAHTEAQMIDRVFLAGADDYIPKPIQPTQLITRILNRLGRVQNLGWTGG